MPPYRHWNQAPHKGQQVPGQDIPSKFSSNKGTQPWASRYRLPKVTPKPYTSHNSLLDISLHSREKKYSSIDKTSTLKMRSFSTVRVTQRGSQRYMEKRRGRRELEVTRMRWGGINRGESGLTSNHFLMCTPQLDCSEMFSELYREEKREEGDRGGQEDKRREWKGERQIQPVISSLSVLHCLEHTEIHRVG